MLLSSRKEEFNKFEGGLQNLGLIFTTERSLSRIAFWTRTRKYVSLDLANYYLQINIKEAKEKCI
jgi:hypothetical protein